jgi:hypothetical protein
MNRTTKLFLVAGGLALAAISARSLAESRTAERVPYDVVRRLDGVELRRYPRTVLVETTAPTQRDAFFRLFRYITGANRDDSTFEMTAPVRMEPSGREFSMTAPVRRRLSGEGATMAFYLPAETVPERAPLPTDETVELVVEEPRTLAVVSFSWWPTAGRVERAERRLLATLADHGIEAVAEPFLLGYDAPWTPPFLRTNEVAVEVRSGE